MSNTLKNTDLEVYLAGCCILPNYIKKQPMDVYLAGTYASQKRLQVNDNPIFQEKLYILESFYYIADWQLPFIKDDRWNFMLDSGAFTFMNSKKNSQIDWDDYVERYAAFILEYDINLFFELDIDAIVGIKEVERLRYKLESITGKQCIPVWHKSRGLDYWHKMTDDYKYVAIGGIVTAEIAKTEHDIFIPLLAIAHEKQVRVHGLGYTSTGKFYRYKFDSVDSTAWLTGNIHGIMYFFNETPKLGSPYMIRREPPNGTRCFNPHELCRHNFEQWVKFQKYAKQNL